MVYSNKFVLSVLVNGHIQQELSNGCVPLPFDAEYILRFRNKHNRRAVVKFWIDGENVSGNGYLIEANSHTDIKRHRDVDKSFKFVSLDSEDAIDHGKNGPNEDKIKGTIEARFYLEKERPAYVPPTYVPIPMPYPVPQPYPVPRPNWYDWRFQRSVTFGGTENSPLRGIGGSMCDSNISYNTSPEMQIKSGVRTSSLSPASSGSIKLSDNMPGVTHKGIDDSFLDTTKSLHEKLPLQDGCTVEGNVTGQSFVTVNIDLEDTYTTLRIFLQGKHVDAPEAKPKKQSVELTELEAENERLRQELAEEENQLLREKLDSLKKSKKKPIVKRKPTKKA